MEEIKVPGGLAKKAKEAEAAAETKAKEAEAAAEKKAKEEISKKLK